MNIREFFRGKYLKASDLENDLTVTIQNCSGEEFEEGEKPVLYFEEIDQALVLNKTNGKILADQFGFETSDWPGKKVTVYKTDVEYKGKRQPGLRLRISNQITDDDIPF